MHSLGFSFLGLHQLGHSGLSTSLAVQLFSMELYLGSMKKCLVSSKASAGDKEGEMYRLIV